VLHGEEQEAHVEQAALMEVEAHVEQAAHVEVEAHMEHEAPEEDDSGEDNSAMYDGEDEEGAGQGRPAVGQL
jgi:hypothetical protein